MSLEINKVHNIDCVKGMSDIVNDSIDLTVTSPPFQALRDYNGFSWDFSSVAQELFRVTKQGGIVCWNEGDSVVDGSETLSPLAHAIYFKACGFNVHDTMIYQKKNFSNPEKTRYHQTWEYVFILSKGKPKTFNPIKDRPNICAGKIGSVGNNTVTQVDGSKLVRPRKVNTQFGIRHNVWLGNTRGQEEMGKSLSHPAMMPRWLARDLILSWSNQNDVVLDPFAGSGTTLEEAQKTFRQFVGFEISEEYCKIANKNLGL